MIIACTVGCGNEGNGKSWMGDQGSTVSAVIVLYLKMHHFFCFVCIMVTSKHNS